MRVSVVLLLLFSLMLELLEGACPSMQKFAGTARDQCKLGNQGQSNTIQCTADIVSFTMTGWIKLTTNDSILSAAGNADVYFSLQNSADNYKRLFLQYDFAAAQFSRFYSPSTEPQVRRLPQPHIDRLRLACALFGRLRCEDRKEERQLAVLGAVGHWKRRN